MRMIISGAYQGCGAMEHYMCGMLGTYVFGIDGVLHRESNRGQASPRTMIRRMCQPQEAVQTECNQTVLQRDTPAQKTK